MRRREFITLLGGAAATWPLAARAQQAMPMIGYLNTGSLESEAQFTASFRRGLNEAGFFEGQNVLIEYRWAETRVDRLPALMADLIKRQVSIIAATPGTAARVAKAATSSIPIVFMVGSDPEQLGLVTSLARPEGNATGLTMFANTLTAKRVGVLHDVIPKATRIAVLVNRSAGSAGLVDTAAIEAAKEAEAAAAVLQLEVVVINAANNSDIDAAFDTIVQKRLDALLLTASPLFEDRRLQIATLAKLHGIPAIYPLREYAEAGGLMSYGTSRIDASRQMGAYVARILKGAKPGDLPVLQPTKFEFVINLQIAKAINLEIPPGVLAQADEVIE